MADTPEQIAFKRGYMQGWTDSNAGRDYSPEAGFDYPVGRPASGATPTEACERCTHWMNLHDATGCTVVYNPEQPDVFCPCPTVPAERCWAQCGQECRDHCGGPVRVSAGDGAGAAQTTTHPFRPARKMIGRRMVDIDVCVESTQRTPGSSRQTCRLPADDPIHSGLDRPADPGITDPDYWRLWAHPFQPDEFGRLCDAGSERKCDRRADHPIHQTTTPAETSHQYRPLKASCECGEPMSNPIHEMHPDDPPHDYTNPANLGSHTWWGTTVCRWPTGDGWRLCSRPKDHPIHQTTTPADHIAILDGEVEA